MDENENIEKNDAQSDCASGNCSSTGAGKDAGKMKYAAFGFIMLLAVGVAASALIEKAKNPNASTCGTNACTTCPSQLGGSATCDDSSNCPLTAKAKTTDACSSSQKTCESTCSKDSAVPACSIESSACSSEKTCTSSKTCSEAKTCGSSETCGDKTTTGGVK